MQILSARGAAVAMVAACGGDQRAEADVKEPSAPGGKPIATIKLTSPAFAAGAEIPTEHTCEGKDSSPPLAWDGVPAAAKAVGLIVDDPDAPDPAAPQRGGGHWGGSLPGGVGGLGPRAAASLPKGAAVGNADWGNTAWGGPCPPIGRHRYFFKLYALDAAVEAGGRDKAAVVAAMDGHVLARGELIGTYQKKK